MKRNTIMITCFIIFIMISNTVSASFFEKDSLIRDIKIMEISQLTGQNSINNTEELYDVAGTDLGSVFELDGIMYYLFGDTFGRDSYFPPERTTTNWRSNVIAFSSDLDPEDGIKLDGFLTNQKGTAREIIPSKKNNGDHLTSIPTNGIALDGNIFVYYMAVNRWGAPGHWETKYSGVYFSGNKGKTWEPIEDLKWDGDSNFAQVAIIKNKQNNNSSNKDIYFYGVKAGRFSPIKLMKVNKSDIKDKSKYLYFIGIDEKGSAKWSDTEKEAITILDTTAGELSVVWNPYLERWFMLYMNGETTNIDISIAPNPWGPWVEPVPLVLQRDYPGLYGSFTHPHFIKNKGTSIYFIMSKWFTYNTYVMKADLILNNE